ncbi:MAG: peptide deformylase [Patescibacteria group bacterium]
MAKNLPLVTLPSATLRSRSVEVDPKDIGTPEFQTFLDNLIETMFVEDGVGIASPQVGRNQRIFIVNEKKGPKAYINPEIKVLGELSEDSEEGCLSVPGVWGMVKRAKKVHVTALDRHARRVEFDVKGFLATVFQHEFDHVEGILFIDKAYKITKGKEKTAIR